METLKETLKIIALLAVCVCIPWIAWDLMKFAPPSVAETVKPSLAEAVTIVLGAVTVVLAVLAIIVATLAVWGYQSIKGEAASAADRAVKSTVEAVVSKHANDDRLRSLLRKEIRRLVGEAVDESDLYTEAFSEDAAKADTQHGSVGSEYPKDDAGDGKTG